MSSRRVAIDKRKRTETSCDICKSRKQKCDRPVDQDRCRYCLAHDLDCTTKQPRKKRLYGSFEGVGTRIQLLESLVKGLVPEANLSSNEEMRRLGSSLGIPLPAEDADASELEKRIERPESSDGLPLLPDQQGQGQYTGPASSFSFHLKLRSLLDNYSTYEFVLFGPNAAEADAADSEFWRGHGNAGRLYLTGKQSTSGLSASSSDQAPELEIDVQLSNDLVKSFFESVHPDFPILHEASFRSQYESWSRTQCTSDRVWLCSLLCVFMLSWRHASAEVSPQQERSWWRRIQSLLPMVFFRTSITAIQVLMLSALHLHNTMHRDACWNLTGTAIRMAHAIGLHSDEVTSYQSPLTREFRKSLWWLLMAFEQFQISSYDRPCAIDSSQCNVAHADERIVGLGFYYPPDMVKSQNRLTTLLASVCRARRLNGSNPYNESNFGTLSSAANALRELHRWKETISSHLRLESLELSAPCFFRPLLLLHAHYHYTIIVLSRSALLQRATLLSQGSTIILGEGLLAMSEACRDSGRVLGNLVQTLDAVGKFNALTWFDTFYTITAALALVLDIVCSIKHPDQHDGNHGGIASMKLLQDLADMSERYMRHPRIPSTLRKWASLITELAPMAVRYTQGAAKQQVQGDGPTQTLVQRQQLVIQDARLSVDLRRSQARSGQATMSANLPTQGVGEVPLEDGPFTTGFDPEAANIQEWRWDDIEAMLNM